MSKYKKVTYCNKCGSSNPWALSKTSSLLESPNFCSSCGHAIVKNAKEKEPTEVEAEAEEEIQEIRTDIPPLELDIEGCVFGAKNSQPLSNLLKPVPQESPEDGG